MKAIVTTIVVGAAICAADTATAAGLGGEISVPLYNTYYFRGTNVYENNPNLQPSVTLSWTDATDTHTLSLNVWSAIPFLKRDRLKSVRDEVDLTMAYDLSIAEGLNLSAGAIVYMNTDADPFFHTEEIFIAIDYEIGLGFSVGGGVYGDINAFKGVYVNLSPAYGYELLPGFSLTVGGVLGATLYEDGGFAFVESGGSLGLAYAFDAGFTFGIGALANYNVSAELSQVAVNAGVAYGW